MDVVVPVYRYFTADIVTGSIVMEIPFSSVTWQRRISGVGSFNGSIAVPTDALTLTRVTTNDDHFDLYNSTIPGKHALYVVRDGICVWGGIVWTREYNIVDKTLNVEAQEFSKYLWHRVFWKSFAVDVYQATNNTGPNTDSKTLKEFLSKLIECVNKDQDEYLISGITSNDPYAYLASDMYCRVNTYEVVETVAHLITEEEHNFSVGDEIIIRGVLQGIDGTAFVTAVPDTRQFSISTSLPNIPLTDISSSSATYAILSSRFDLLSAASSVNIEIDIDDSLAQYYTEAFGDNNQYDFRGSALQYVGDIIQNYASTGLKCKSITAYGPTDRTLTVRFDYLIESTFNPRQARFTNTFKAWKVRQDYLDPVSGGVIVDFTDLYGPSKLAANSIVFEHPGNIVNITLRESAENSATRFWMVDSGNDMPDAASKYYGSYTNIKYLEQGWPIFDFAKTDTNLYVMSDEQVAPHAKQYAYRTSPPIGSFTVTVNGSLSPVVGSYKPGDWCIVVPNDQFLKSRLKSPYEPRKDMLVRKIRSISVSVPDNPAFPETVDLELVPEWQVAEDV